jgi:hypothetical protein
LVVRPDYSDTLAAAADALAKIEQFKVTIAQASHLVKDLKTLNSKIDRRGRQLLDVPTSSALENLGRSARALTAAKIPLSPDDRLQLTDSLATLSQMEGRIDGVMDREEKRILTREMPSQSGGWKFLFETDKITDEERVRAGALVEGSQARYELTLVCQRTGGELRITTFVPSGTDAKRIQWILDGPAPDRRIRLRIDSNPAFGASLEMRGYVNQGQVRLADISVQFENLVHSSRLVFADIFPEEEVEVATAFPSQFSRLCELLTGSAHTVSRP